MKKRLIVCCDGTWNAPEINNPRKNRATNVLKLCRRSSLSHRPRNVRSSSTYPASAPTTSSIASSAARAAGASPGISSRPINSWSTTIFPAMTSSSSASAVAPTRCGRCRASSRRPASSRKPRCICSPRRFAPIATARSHFKPALWTSKLPWQTVEQVWFPGAHSDVGGGLTSAGLSDAALAWMMTRARAAGLAFDPQYQRDYVQPDPISRSTSHCAECIGPSALMSDRSARTI